MLMTLWFVFVRDSVDNKSLVHKTYKAIILMPWVLSLSPGIRSICTNIEREFDLGHALDSVITKQNRRTSIKQSPDDMDSI